ncbi:gibberellin 2-beta-dioxygenase-like [Carya illinoinensis]|uniref:gibberellin 2-beta-dioxygenase-like n=1 Tax=Carya illinoinensis TaxID=32201 RepID=UPI001C729915|nr:gibberellin 2-beta-dioxygenase-like [Carya illinoinensis]
MVVLSQPAALDDYSLIQTHKPPDLFTGIPVVDLSDPNVKTLIAKALEFGIFKVVNQGFPVEFMKKLEAEALRFFNLPQSKKDSVGPPDLFGYGSKRIGPNGDVGWIEYILLNTNPEVISHKSFFIFQENPVIFR